MKPHFTLGSILRKPKDSIKLYEKSGLVYQISGLTCDAVYIGEKGGSIKTRKKEHVKAVRDWDEKVCVM